ncbi:hypothetical protein QTO01_17590 [Vibrio mytili]|uniref:DUF6701 domain-containing protein n=1 Tax=Vibrio mytili TaxID=50718 RepID=UPI002F4003BF
MRKLKVFNLLLVLSAFWSSFSFAFDASMCSNLKSGNNTSFSIKFTIENTTHNEVINAVKGVGSDTNAPDPIALWANSASAGAVITDNLTEVGKSYNVWLTYEPQGQGNKQGLLKYYLYFSDGWHFVSSNIAYLDDLNSVNIAINGVEVTELVCDDALITPGVITEPTPKFEICKYFPQPIQGWKGSTSTLNIQNATQISGWSSEYLNDDTNIYNYRSGGTNWDNLRVGFDKGVNKWWLYQVPFATSCDGYGCFPKDGVSGDGITVGDDGFVESRKAETPTNITPNFGSSSLYISPDKNDAGIVTEGFCNNNPSICSYGSSSSGLKEPQITVLSSLKNLTINNHNDTFDKLTVVIADGVQIESVNIPRGDNVIFQTLDDSTVTFGNWKEDTGATVYSFGNNSRINIVNSFNMANKMKVANTNSVTLYAPEGDIDFSTTNDEFYGFILGKTVSFSNSITVHGAVTSQYLSIHTTNVVIKRPTDACSAGGGNIEGKFVVEPRWQYGLTCERIPVDFKLLNDQGALVDSNDSFIPLADPNSNISWCSSEQGNTCDLASANLVNGRQTLYLSAENIGEVVVGAIYDLQTYSGGSVKFVPYKLAAEDQYVIAGKQQSVKVKALACNDAGGVEAMGYDGSPTISASWISPSTAASDLLTYEPSFNSGTSDSTLTIDESGKLEVTLEDSNFDCTGITGCPIEGHAKLKGSFMVYSRPWAFTLCSTGNTDIYSATGTSASGNGFIAAGEEFDLQVLPIKYQGGISSGEVESNGVWCNASNVTSNFFLDSSFGNHVKLLSEVATPEEHVSTALLASNDALIQSRVTNDQAYNFTNLYWNDVGSLKVMAATENYNAACSSPVGLESWYECTQRGYRNIGRFYPKYFQVYDDDSIDITNSWAYPDGQSFTYMGQGFGAEAFYVEALNAQKGSVSNYKWFDESLQATFSLMEDSSYTTRFTSGTYNGEWVNNQLTGVESQSIGQFSGAGLNMSKDTATYDPDGPFNLNESGSDTAISIQGIAASDPVLVDDGEGVLRVQPDIRFGRIDLDDVGGNQGATLSVPLRVEYWNGNRFVQNTDDNGTAIDSVLEKQQPIWPNDGSDCTVLLEGNDTVIDGVTRELSAKQDQSTCDPVGRQQTRVWLDLDDAANALPWLKYDWDNDGSEENPSSVVTFGIHRGNDRVIYRGEPGLTGQ